MANDKSGLTENVKNGRIHGEGMMAIRQILRRVGRTTDGRICPASADCIVRTVSFGPDPLEAAVNQKVYNTQHQMTERTDRSEIKSLFGCIRDGAKAWLNWREVSDTPRQCGMNAARQRLRRVGRTGWRMIPGKYCNMSSATGARTRSASSDCVVRTVLFVPDPLRPHGTGII